MTLTASPLRLSLLQRLSQARKRSYRVVASVPLTDYPAQHPHAADDDALQSFLIETDAVLRQQVAAPKSMVVSVAEGRAEVTARLALRSDEDPAAVLCRILRAWPTTTLEVRIAEITKEGDRR